MGRPREDYVARFWAKVDKTDGCWLWTARRDGGGYGMLRRPGAGSGWWFTHRLSYEMHIGQIPVAICVCHHCDTPACVRPDHLFLGTIADNNADRHRKGRTARGVSRWNATLSPPVVEQIRRFAKAGFLGSDIAEVLEVSRGTVSAILNGKTWKHVQEASK